MIHRDCESTALFPSDKAAHSAALQDADAGSAPPTNPKGSQPGSRGLSKATPPENEQEDSHPERKCKDCDLLFSRSRQSRLNRCQQLLRLIRSDAGLAAVLARQFHGVEAGDVAEPASADLLDTPAIVPMIPHGRR